MEFEQKAEEKKMSMNKNIARLAVTAGLTAALSFGGVMAPATMAFATTLNNRITIKQNAENTDATNPNRKTQFVAYQIFNAKVVDGTSASDKVVSDVAWAENVTEPTQASIINAIKQSAGYDSSKSKLPEDKTPTAQDVADWMADNLQDASWVVNNGDLLDTIADLVKGTTPAMPRGASSAAFAADDTSISFKNSGYYLFLTDDSSIGTKDSYSELRQTGTSPIFAVIGGSAVEVTEKTGIPTVTKKIKDDKSGAGWADKADSQVGQNVKYQLTGTVAENVASFDSYYYEFRDELSAGLTVTDASIKVFAGSDRASAVEITSGFTPEVKNAENGAGQTLTVKFDNLKLAVANLSSSTKIFVEYTAQLDPNKAVVGGEGNENTVKLIYSNNPMSDGKGESVPDTVRDYTYALKLVKGDSADETAKLSGVKFTIQATGADEGDGTKFVQEDGSLGADSYEFTTDRNGEINIKGLDAGTYTVEETHTLDGYNTLPKFTFTITADGLGNDEGNNNLSVSATKNGSDLVMKPSVDNGTVTLTVKNKKGSGLPLTGLNGVTFTWIAGGAVLCIGVAHLIRSRKQAEESEQE
ncbi:isopeptide-forming domain-containing fimbrial protein [Collinsella aerofaciens]|uniref:isopeptide-forming domain-containing fimbrial protein n=1 Tax=Collinsella aerofaciens TaxID=74426 RepID=UPI0034A23AA1